MSEPARFTVEAIGTVHSTRAAAVDDGWDAVTAYVELDAARFSSESLAGLATFSHAEVLFVLHQVPEGKVTTGARHPRENLAWPKVGIFAQRGRVRPNRIGATVCRIERVEGLRVYLQGLDAIDGTPVLDLKPWVRELGPRGETRQPGWMDELMRPYWK